MSSAGLPRNVPDGYDSMTPCSSRSGEDEESFRPRSGIIGALNGTSP